MKSSLPARHPWPQRAKLIHTHSSVMSCESRTPRFFFSELGLGIVACCGGGSDCEVGRGVFSGTPFGFYYRIRGEPFPPKSQHMLHCFLPFFFRRSVNAFPMRFSLP